MKVNENNLKYIAIISLVLIGGFSSAYALITITLDGDVIVTGDMVVQGILSGTTIENLQSQIESIPEGPQGPQGEKGDKGHKGDPGKPLHPCENYIQSNLNAIKSNSTPEYCFVVGPDTCENFQTQFNLAKHNTPEPICFVIPQGTDGLPGADGQDGLPGKDGAQGPPGKDGESGFTGLEHRTVSQKKGFLPGQQGGIGPNCNPQGGEFAIGGGHFINNGGFSNSENTINKIIVFQEVQSDSGHTVNVKNTDTQNHTVTAVVYCLRMLPVSLPTVSDPPQNFSIQVIGTDAIFSWNPPIFDGGSPLVEYVVQINPIFSDGSIGSWNLPTTDTTITQSLPANTEFKATIYANNAIGNSNMPTEQFFTTGP